MHVCLLNFCRGKATEIEDADTTQGGERKLPASMPGERFE
jgi:hypothetical protein